MVDLLPEGYEVVDGGDDGDDDHEVDGDEGGPLYGEDEVSEVPLVPAVGEDGGDDGDDLDDGLEFAEVAGLDGESFNGGDGAQSADEEFASDDEDGDPRFDDVRIVGDQGDEGGRR